MAKNIFPDATSIDTEYKNIHLEEPEENQACLVTDGKGFYDVMIWLGSKGWDCVWNKGYYKIYFWTPLPFMSNQKDMLKEQVDIEIDQQLMKNKKF